MMIVLEGIDGSGKSTHLEFLRRCASARGGEVVLTREPGGCPLAERLRHEVLQTPMDSLTELLLVFAARRAHLAQTVWPALARGACVISDRYVDSTYAYQGGGRGLPWETITQLTTLVEGDWGGPSKVIYFDCPPEVAAARRAGRASTQDQTIALTDRFDAETVAFFDRVRAGYREAAARRGERAVWVDATQPISVIEKLLEEKVFNN